MKTKLFKKVISLALAISMIATLFVGLNLAPMTVSAANTDMLVFEASGGGRFVNYRPNTGIFDAGARYLYSFDIDYSDAIDAQLASGDRKESHYWKINYFNTSSTWSEIALANLTIVKTALTHGDHYDVTFTAPSDARDYNNISLIFGDFWYNGCDQYFKVGNLNLWKIDSSGNKLSQISLTMPGSIDSIVTVDKSGSNSAYKQARTGSNSNWACPKGYRNGFSFTAQNGYFNPILDSDLVTFDGTNNYGCFIYTTGWSTVAAGNYRLEMDCRITSGTPVFYPMGRYPEDPNNSYFTNREYAYDSAYHKYTTTFTVTESYDGNLSVYLGNYGGSYGGTGDAIFSCANPTLYLLDSSGNPTGENILNTFNSEFYTTESDVNANSVNKWRQRYDGWSCKSPVPDGYFDIDSDMVSFTGKIDYGCFIYTTNTRSIAAGNYRLQMDCKVTSGTPVLYPMARYAEDSNNSYFTNRTYTYDSLYHKYTTTFTITENYSGNLSVYIGNYGGSYGGTGDAAFDCANPTLYLLDSSGNPTGENILNTFNSEFYTTESDVNANSVNKWRRRYSGWSCTTPSPSGYFDPDGKVVHFPAGYNNYHVLVYKGGAITPGKYRFRVYENAAGGIESTVGLFVDSAYNREVSKTSDVLSGNIRTVEFELVSSWDSFIILLGNFGNGENMDTYYKCPTLYKIIDGNVTGNSLIDDFTTENVVLATGKTRVSAQTGKWTSLNWAKGYITFNESTNNSKMLKLGGNGTSMQALSLEKALDAGATYQFDMDYRANGGVSALRQVSAIVSGTEYSSLTSENTIFKTDTGTHLSVRFTTASGTATGAKNFRIYIGQSWPQKRNGTVYFANFTLRKVTNNSPGNENLIYNGDFNMGNTGTVTSSNKDTVFSGWNQIKVMTYTRVEIMDIPDNFFVDNQNMNCDKVYEFKGGDMYKPQFNFQFLSNRKYRLMYDYFCDNDDTVNAYIISKDNSVTAEKTSRIGVNRFEAVYDIAVGANADPYNDSYAPNGNIRFALNGNSYDKAFCIGNIRMYYLDEEDNITGANLVYNLNPILPDGYYGFDEIGDVLDFTLAKDDSGVASQKKNIGVSWVGNLNYTNENVGCYSRIVKTNGRKFDYYSNAQNIAFARKAILESGTGYNPVGDTGSRYHDPNKDGTLNVRDLVRYKNNAKNGVNSFAVANEQTNGGIYDSFNKVVCYGDSITQGMGYSASQAYPGRLQSMIGSGYTVVNSGDAGESSDTIMSRQGVYTLKTANSMTFPAGTATITIGNQDNNGFVSTNGDYIGLTSALGNENTLNNITIGGNQYTISLSNFVWSPRSYTVNLTRVGSTSSAITIPAGTKTVFRGTTQQDTCEIYLVGANDDDKSADKLVAKYKAMVDNHGSNNFLIIIPYFGGVSKTPFLDAFGDHCVDFKTIASTDEAFAYEGLTKTADDENMISQSRLPLSFRRVADENEVHLNDKGYDLLAHHLYLQGQALSYFDSPALRKVNQTYRYEIHMHDKEVSACGQSLGSKYITKAKSMGFAGFIITNHFYRGNTAIDKNLSWSDFIDAYKEDYEKLKAEAAAEDMDVLFGIEDDYDNEHHCLIYGISPDLWKTVPNYPSMTFPQVYDFVHSNGGIIVYAHPYRDPSDANLSGYPDMRYADAIEVYNASRSDESNQLALDYALAHNLIMTAGSDAHNFNSFGQGAMEFTHRLYTIENFIEEVLAENYTIIRGQ